jgi:hypothetical protein
MANGHDLHRRLYAHFGFAFIAGWLREKNFPQTHFFGARELGSRLGSGVLPNRVDQAPRRDRFVEEFPHVVRRIPQSLEVVTHAG